MAKHYSNEHQANINRAWATLSKLGNPSVTVQCHYPDEDGTIDTLRYVSSLIKSMESFNNKDNRKIGNGFTSFFNKLPTVPRNNASKFGPKSQYVFTSITLKSDDTIILDGMAMSKDTVAAWEKDLTKFLENTKRLWKADECKLYKEQHPMMSGCVNLRIRIWWD